MRKVKTYKVYVAPYDMDEHVVVEADKIRSNYFTGTVLFMLNGSVQACFKSYSHFIKVDEDE